MKKLLVVFLIPALAFMVSCGGSDDNGVMSQMKKMKEMADNAKEMQEEMDANPEDSDKIFSESLLAKMDITNTDRKVSDEEWNKVIKIIEDYNAMDSTEKADLNHETLNAFFTDRGYADLGEAEKDLERIGRLSSFLMDWGMHFAIIKQVRLMDGKDAEDEKIKELAAKISEDGYSKEDLRAIEENAKYSTKALKVLYEVTNFDSIKIMKRMSDSLNLVRAAAEEELNN